VAVVIESSIIFSSGFDMLVVSNEFMWRSLALRMKKGRECLALHLAERS